MPSKALFCSVNVASTGQSSFLLRSVVVHGTVKACRHFLLAVGGAIRSCASETIFDPRISGTLARPNGEPSFPPSAPVSKRSYKSKLFSVCCCTRY